MNSIKETIKFIIKQNPQCSIEEIISELKEIKALGKMLTERKKDYLCKRGKDYIKARNVAGEKSSAYLSGRAVKVCKGQIKFKGKKKKSY
jgi:hypothetical protein